MKRGIVVLCALLAACARKGGTGDSTRLATSDTQATPPVASAPAAGGVATPDTAAAASRGVSTTPRSADTVARSSMKGEQSKAVQRSSSSPTDTVRGIVAVVGTEHDKHVIVRPANGRAITLEGPQAVLVGRTSGAEVWIAGTRGERNSLTVARFAVRTVDGIVAVDGMLESDGNQLVLVTPDGQRHRVANPPDALRQHVGARVWISGNLDQGPVAYGIIQDKP